MLLSYPSYPNLTNQGQKAERRLHFYDRGEEIPLVSQGVWQITRGVVQLHKLNMQGEETLLGWAHSQHFFGLWFTGLDTFQAKSLSDVYLRWYSTSEIEKDPILTQTILNQIIHRLKQTEELLAIAGLKKVEERLMELLKLLSREIGENHEKGKRLHIRLTHQNLANAINSTRVTVTRLLGELQKQGLISFDRHRHLIIHH